MCSLHIQTLFTRNEANDYIDVRRLFVFCSIQQTLNFVAKWLIPGRNVRWRRWRWSLNEPRNKNHISPPKTTCHLYTVESVYKLYKSVSLIFIVFDPLFILFHPGIQVGEFLLGETRSQLCPTTIQWILNGGWLTLSCWLTGVGPVAVPQKMRNPLATIHRDWRRNYDQRWARWLPVHKTSIQMMQTVGWYQSKMSFMSFASFHQIPGQERSGHVYKFCIRCRIQKPGREHACHPAACKHLKT